MPGQFAEVHSGSKDVFLRRPFSIHDVDYSENTISLLVKKVGKGTEALASVVKGNFVNVIYPLGKGFSIKNAHNVLLIGGGTGIAPLLLLAKRLYEKNVKSSILTGGKTKQDILRIEEFKKYGKVFVSTEDGSMGDKGLVTENKILSNPDFNCIYTCGPEPMMKAVAGYARKNNIFCEVSLENTMACGIGACLCCVVNTVEGNKCVCTEGPVFNINELKWQI